MMKTAQRRARDKCRHLGTHTWGEGQYADVCLRCGERRLYHDMLDALVPDVSRVRLVNEAGDKTSVLVFKRRTDKTFVVHCDPGANFKDNEIVFNLTRHCVELAKDT